MSQARPQTRSTKPRKTGQHPTKERSVFLGRYALPSPGRLAGLGGLVVVAVAALVMLVSVSAGGLNRFGLQRLAADAPTSAPARSSYINR